MRFALDCCELWIRVKSSFCPSVSLETCPSHVLEIDGQTAQILWSVQIVATPSLSLLCKTFCAPAVVVYVGIEVHLQGSAPEPVCPLSFNLRCVGSAQAFV